MDGIALTPRSWKTVLWSCVFLWLPASLATAESDALHCSTVIVGRLASSDGSVLLAHDEDLQADAAQHLVSVPHRRHQPGDVIKLWSGAKVPQAPETFGYFATKIFDKEFIPGDVVTGINEYQVAIANNLAHQRDEVPDLESGRMIWTEFMQLALERAKTAREAVRIIGECAQRYKLASDPGTMFGITDPAEGWWMEVTQEGQWVAQRVPDQGYAMRANAYRIGTVNFNDPQSFLYSPDLVTCAVKKGWYSSSTDGDFNFAEVYGSKSDTTATYNTHRQERADQLLKPLLPKISVVDLMAVLRDHFEGTSWDLAGEGSPHKTDERTICRDETVVSAVIQSRGWLPPEIGGVCWLAMGTPCTGTYIPWYQGTRKVPSFCQKGRNKYSSDSAYWVFRRLTDLVDKDYKKSIVPVRARWGEFEKLQGQVQPGIEEAARHLYPVDKQEAIELLNGRSMYYASRAFEIAKDLVTGLE